MKPFIRKTRLKAPVEQVFAWHARPGAIERLSPPWDPLAVVYQSGGIQEGAEVILKMRAGPFVKYHWHARHTACRENRFFVDEQTRGPFSFWKHTHRFEPADNHDCLLEDRIDYRLPLARLTHLLAGPLITRKLDRIFAYRHRVTAADLNLHRKYETLPRQTVLISGASGLIGSRLIPLLTTGGHQVIRLVRKPPAGPGEIFWDPAAGKIDTTTLAAQPIDAAIHLAGENVGTDRWTPAKKAAIIQSRIDGTSLLVNALKALPRPPRSFLSASAIGFYGHRGETLLTESAAPGNDFLSGVCAQWEKAAQEAAQHGLRTVSMRIGVVLTPEGGALQRLLPPFQTGLGGRIGAGRQYLSWIAIDDVLGGIYHLLMDESLSGAFNLVAPRPVSNREFTRTLAGVLSRPAICPVPARLIRGLFGEMGREILLASTRVQPEQLLATGYAFRYPELTQALQHLLGKPAKGGTLSCVPA